MDDKTILAQIHKLVDEEHTLRTRVQGREISTEDEHARLRAVEESLDQCWDLLRQRRAAREFGSDPESAHARNKKDVESYLQ